MESDARSTGVQLKSAAWPSTVIGLIIKHSDCCITFEFSFLFVITAALVLSVAVLKGFHVHHPWCMSFLRSVITFLAIRK